MKILLKGGNDITLPDYTPVSGELLVNSSNSRLYGGDNSTPGGVPLNLVGSLVFTVDQPSITVPSSGAVVILTDLLLMSSPFAGAGLHTASEWEIATDIAFTNVVHSHYSTTDLTQHNPFDNGFVNATTGATYYARVRYYSSAAGVSDWSTGVDFITGVRIPNTYSQKIIPPDGQANDKYGYNISISEDGTMALVSAYEYVYPGTPVGSVYVYKILAGVWTQTQKLHTGDNYFGTGAAINVAAGYALIGTPSDTSSAVAIYTVDAVNGTLTYNSALPVPPGGATTWFGFNIDIASDGTEVLISAVGTNSISGYVYHYTVTGLSFTLRTQTPHPFPTSGQYYGDGFGAGVSISEDKTLIAVGAYGYSGGAGTSRGVIFVYSVDASWNWTLIQTITNASTVDLSGFGTNLKMSDDKNLIITGGLPNQTLIYVLNGGSYAYDSALSNPGPDTTNEFGKAIGLSGDNSILAVGAYYDDNSNGTDAGAIYVYTG